MAKITELKIAGYKSFREITLPLSSLNVVIGANGAGKSNLVSFFKMLTTLQAGKFQQYVGLNGGSKSLLHHGPKTTREIVVGLKIESWPLDETIRSEYTVTFEDAAIDTLIIGHERTDFMRLNSPTEHRVHIFPGGRETALTEMATTGERGAAIVGDFLKACHTFQFDDTSSTAGIRRPIYAQDSKILRGDGANLAAVLYRLQKERTAYYRRIVETIRQIAPFFDDFVLQPGASGTDVTLNWRQKESDYLFGPHQLSDGTLRAMALVTLLLQPEDELPQLVVIDEPELGLHPFAIGVLGSLLKQASHSCQIIVATQSAALLNEVEPEDVVVVERGNRESTVRRLASDELQNWLEDYTLRDLWERNIIGGGPR